MAADNLILWLFTDPHLGDVWDPTPDVHWNEAVLDVNDIIASQSNGIDHVDYVFGLGDISQFNSPQDYQDYKNGRSLSTIPLSRWYELAGNHDGCNQFRDYLGYSLAPDGGIRYSLSHGNVHFVLASDDYVIGLALAKLAFRPLRELPPGVPMDKISISVFEGPDGKPERYYKYSIQLTNWNSNTQNFITSEVTANSDKILVLMSHHPIAYTTTQWNVDGYIGPDDFAQALFDNNEIDVYLHGHRHLGGHGYTSFDGDTATMYRNGTRDSQRPNRSHDTFYVNASTIVKRSDVPHIDSRFLVLSPGSNVATLMYRRHDEHRWLTTADYGFTMPETFTMKQPYSPAPKATVTYQSTPISVPATVDGVQRNPGESFEVDVGEQITIVVPREVEE